MPRQGQIIPEYLVPHVQTYINDNSIFEEFASTPVDDGVRLISVFASPKGEDRVLKLIDNVAAYIEEFGTPNYNLYGQAGYMPYVALNSGFTKCWCMRITPDDATYSNVVIVAQVQTTANVVHVKFSAKAITDLTDGDSMALSMEGLTVAAPEVNAEGYSEYPIMAIRCNGRGLYGNTLRVRFTSDVLSDADNIYKNYVIEVLDNDGGLVRKETWRATLNEAAIISRESIFMDDVINDVENGSDKIETYVSISNLNAVYEMYAAAVQAGEDTIPFSEFDFLMGKTKDRAAMTRYVIDDDSLALDRADGIVLSGGSDGLFGLTPPAPTMTVADQTAMFALTDADVTPGDTVQLTDTGVRYRLIDTLQIATSDGWEVVQLDRFDAMDVEYLRAFAGTEPYDHGIVSKRRTPAELILDANYSENVKRALAALALRRYDCRCILDAGILSTVTQAQSWLADFANISDRIISKEIQHYKIRDPFNGKVIPVTATYFFAQYLPAHFRTFGTHVPFVGERYAQLTGYIKNTLKPSIDADDLEIKDALYQSRANFFECISEDNFVRATQGTSQLIWSDLSEENNVTVMLEMKRMLEEFVAAKIYNFAEAEDRKRFTEDADRMFSTYQNTKVRSYNVYFDMNAFEEERQILHCYLEVVFRTMAKRGIIEIDINKRITE